MAGKNDRYVVKHPDGWAVKAGGKPRAEKVTSTQNEAISAARATVSKAGGGEVRIQGRNGKFRDSDTVAPGNDPKPPKDKK